MIKILEKLLYTGLGTFLSMLIQTLFSAKNNEFKNEQINKIRYEIYKNFYFHTLEYSSKNWLKTYRYLKRYYKNIRKDLNDHYLLIDPLTRKYLHNLSVYTVKPLDKKHLKNIKMFFIKYYTKLFIKASNKEFTKIRSYIGYPTIKHRNLLANIFLYTSICQITLLPSIPAILKYFNDNLFSFIFIISYIILLLILVKLTIKYMGYIDL